MLRQQKNSHATATPACDGERVFVVYANRDQVWLSAVDFNGKILWQREVGPLEGRYGYGPSPLVYKSLVIVNVDHFGDNYIKAFDRVSGRAKWQQRRTTWYSFSSPVVARLAGRDQLLVSGVKTLTSYDPLDGKVTWSCTGPSNTTAATPVWFDNRVIVTGGDPQTGVKCVRADGRGDVTHSHVQWEDPMKVYVPSPLVVDDRLILIKDVGVATCLDARTGKKYWEERLGGGFSASPTYCDGLVFVPNEKGRMFVFEPGRKFKLVAENDLADGGFASPVIAGGRLYVRTLNHLYCIGGESL
jgi:outer membrane protein assembly factor BamB